MTLVFIGESAVPSYTAVADDVVDNAIDGASLVGKLVYITDTQDWKIIQKDLTLAAYHLPISVDTEISIGEVAQGTPGASPWLVDGSGTVQPVEGDGIPGTPSGGVLSVQGVLNGKEIPISGNIGYSDTGSLDAFSRLRVSSPKTIFNSTFRYDLQPFLFEQSTATGGTISHAPNYASASMVVNSTNGASCVIQSRQYHRYIPAKSQLIAMSQVFGAAGANIRKRAGYFDANNGIFLEQDGTSGIAIVLRTSTGGSPDDTRKVLQAAWNIDTLDGTGASGITLDLSNASILIIDLQWLGMGRVRVGFDINGVIYYCHQFFTANLFAFPYMQTGNLPVRWEITNTGVSGGATMYATCSAVLSEGGDEVDEGFAFSINSTADVSATTSRTPVLAIRPKATFNSIVNRIEVAISEYSLLAGNNDVLVELIYNPTSLTVTGGWTSADSNSSVEFHRTITGITGGTIIGSYFVPSTNANRGSIEKETRGRLPLTLDIAGANPISLVICATSLSNTSACRGRFTWVELR